MLKCQQVNISVINRSHMTVGHHLARLIEKKNETQTLDSPGVSGRVGFTIWIQLTIVRD